MADRSHDPLNVRRVPASRQKASAARSRLVSGIIGGMLLGVGILWLGWILLQRAGGPGFPTINLPGFAPAGTPVDQIALLSAEGITLGRPSQDPALSQQQALFLASQLEPDAATQAKSTTAQYVLLNYPSTSTPALHPAINNVSAWMILYHNIPLIPTDASVDPTPYAHSFHDLYLFLDANSGKELLTVWV